MSIVQAKLHKAADDLSACRRECLLLPLASEQLGEFTAWGQQW